MTLERIKPHLPWITLLLLVLVVGIGDSNFLKPHNLIAMSADMANRRR